MKPVRRLWKPFVASVLVTCLTVAAAPAATASAPSERPTAVAASCPTTGQRFTVGAYPDVYLSGPLGSLYRIPDPNVYFSLWDSWSGIAHYTQDDAYQIFNYCFGSASCDLEYGQLVKGQTNPAIFIYDACWGYYGHYRWIVNGEVFSRYGFSWSKVQVISGAISPLASEPWGSL